MDPTAFEIWLGEIGGADRDATAAGLSGFGFIRGAGSRDIDDRLAPWRTILTGRRTNRWRQSVVARAAATPVGAASVARLGQRRVTALGVLIAATVTSCLGSGEAILAGPTAAKALSGARSTP